MTRSSSYPLAAAVAVLAALMMLTQLGVAQAQDTNPSLDIQNFQPVASPFGIFTVESAKIPGHFEFSGGFLLNFAKDPLVLINDTTGTTEPLVEQQLAGDLLFAIGIIDLFEVGAALPVYFINDAQVGTNTIEGATLGDLRLRPKVQVLDSETGPVGLGFYLQVGFPTGDDEAFASSGSFYARPGAVVDTRVNRLLLSANMTANIQEERKFVGIDVGSQLLYNIGAEYQIVEETWLAGIELYGSTSFDDFLSDQEESPLEALLGAKYRTGTGINFEVGAGAGLVNGYGAPAYRLVGGVRYADYSADWDEDGIANADDACPRDPEDRDGWEDDDGCPDPNNDGDKFVDLEDDCPNDAEDEDGFQDEDGCPDPDNDKDTIADLDDKCPETPGVAEFEGCPIPDSDKDGIFDPQDACPNEPEDKDSFEDEDGCPDGDNDKDKVCDPWIADALASKRLSEDEVQKLMAKMNCTARDACPDKPGILKREGCPAPPKVVVQLDRIEIRDTIHFKPLKAEILDKSEPLLNEITEILLKYPRLTLIEIQGHTDVTRPHAFCDKLSNDRAASVRSYLVSRGVAPERLVSKGYGKRQPLVTGNRRGNPENRRVEFHILKQETEAVIDNPELKENP